MIELPLLLALMLLSMLLALILGSLYKMSGDTTHFVVSNYIEPGLLIMFAIFIVSNMGIAFFKAYKLHRIKAKIRSKLPNLAENEFRNIVYDLSNSKNHDLILDTYISARGVLTHACARDLIIIAKEIIAGRKLEKYTWEGDAVGYMDRDSLNYLICGRWAESKDQLRYKTRFQTEKQYMEENFLHISIPQIRMDKICSLIYFNWAITSIEQNGLEVQVALARRDEKMTLTFCTESDLYLHSKQRIEEMYPELGDCEEILNKLSRLTYYGWLIRNVKAENRRFTVELARGPQNMDMMFKQMKA
ncbi:hypothetical protein RYA05_03840 [Pseudomonas syringae pv. actinidiae]|nr:hypothetical protein [Pseudomonas syringae pv. actinidiae]